MNKRFRTVPDTNVIIAAHKTSHETSPNWEYFQLWEEDKFDLLYSNDTALEYLEKLINYNIPKTIIKKFINALEALGTYIPIEFFHLQVYPSDPDDIAFVLCAHNGDASHLLTYDNDLLNVQFNYRFKICNTLVFLNDYREELKQQKDVKEF